MSSVVNHTEMFVGLGACSVMIYIRINLISHSYLMYACLLPSCLLLFILQWGYTPVLRAVLNGHSNLVEILTGHYGCPLTDVTNVSGPSSIPCSCIQHAICYNCLVYY